MGYGSLKPSGGFEIATTSVLKLVEPSRIGEDSVDFAKIGKLATELPRVVGIMSLPSVSGPRRVTSTLPFDRVFARNGVCWTCDVENPGRQ
jgi:hypothetical protein